MTWSKFGADILPAGISILVNLLHLEENKQQPNFLEIGFRLVTVLSGCGTLFMLGKYFISYHFASVVNNIRVPKYQARTNVLILFLQKLQQTSQLAYKSLGGWRLV